MSGQTLNVPPEVLDHAIRSSSTFKHALKLWKMALGLAALGFCLTLFTIVWGCSAAGLAMLFHVFFVWQLKKDIDAMETPDTFKIDFAQILAAKAVAICFLAYLFAKLRSRAEAVAFSTACASSCSTKLKIVRLSPLITVVLLAMSWVAQLGFFYLMYHTTALNPPPNWYEDIEGTFGIQLPGKWSTKKPSSAKRQAGAQARQSTLHDGESFLSDSGDEVTGDSRGESPLIKTRGSHELELGHDGRKYKNKVGMAQRREEKYRKYSSRT